MSKQNQTNKKRDPFGPQIIIKLRIT
jgi:hypothetical protein